MNTNQKIHEARGLCWHEYREIEYMVFKCKKCGEMNYLHYHGQPAPKNPDYNHDLNELFGAAKELGITYIDFCINEDKTVTVVIRKDLSAVRIGITRKTAAEAFASALVAYIERGR